MSVRWLAVLLVVILPSAGQGRSEQSYPAYFVSTSERSLTLWGIKITGCRDLVRPPTEEYITPAHQALKEKLHWAVCEMDPWVKELVETSPTATVESVFPLKTYSEIYQYPHHASATSAASAAGATGAKMSTPVSISSQSLERGHKALPEFPDVVRKARSYLQSLWPSKNLDFISHYEGTTEAPILELVITDVRGQVIKEQRYWERIHLIVWFIRSADKSVYFVSVIDGSYAPGIGPVLPRQLNSCPLNPRTIAILRHFSGNSEMNCDPNS